MSYAAALESLHARIGELHAQPGQPRRKFRLEDMRTLVEALGHPQKAFRSILIAGTNGKGSTAATLASILQAAGYRCGLYTSPHLERVNERVQVDGNPIADADFARLYFRVDECARRLVQEAKLPSPPSFFETLTALAFLAFAEAGIDIAVVEVGMGGRLDATNVVDPLISVITDISLDHMEWLGDTIPEIAREKAGILRRNGILVTLPQHPQANQAIGEVATDLDVRGVNAAEYVPAVSEGVTGRYSLQVLEETIAVDSPLPGVHQNRNRALAIATAVELARTFGFRVTPAQIAEGIRRTQWPGRLERLSVPGQGQVILDVAHNPAGAWALRAALSSMQDRGEWPRGARSILVFGCMKDKAYREMAQILFPLFDEVVVTPVASPRSASADELLAAAAETGVRAMAAPNGREALQFAWNESRGPIVVAGSVYLVGEVRPLLQQRAEPGLAVAQR